MESLKDKKPAPSLPVEKKRFSTISGKIINRLYTEKDVQDSGSPDRSRPGEFPYTRGIHENMYRGKLWTMRQFSGFGTPEETNERFRFLLSQGQHGLSVAFDLPTLMGLDSDNSLSAGEVGKCGVAIDSLEDMEILFDQIDLETVTTSMTINSPAAILLAMYVAVAKKQGAEVEKISGTCQNDILKEYIAQKEWIYPPNPSMRLVVDSIAFCTDHLPRYNSVSISGYHIREAGSTAAQELAFTLRDGIEYVDWCCRADLDVDEFAPRLSFFFNAHNDFFEEIAKYRAARRLWANVMKDRFGATSERSWKLRFHTQTAGCSLTAQQPYLNIVRTAIQALAGVLGGTNSLHTNSLDEALALPTAEAAQIALRTQQIIGHESGVTNTVDPLGGSYFVETLTHELESEAQAYFHKIDSLGGMISAIEEGFPQREIQEAAYQYQKSLERNEKIMVGVNAFQVPDEPPIDILQIGEEVRTSQVQRLRNLKRRRDDKAVSQSLTDLKNAARGSDNLMPHILRACEDYATLGEMCETLKEVFGTYQEPVF